MGSYTESNFRPTIQKIGAANASNTGSTVVLIDPNPNNEIVPLEDLFIYAELKARISPKSLLVKNQDHTFVLTNTKGKTISVGTPQGGDGNVISESQLFGNNLTTSWTEIGGIKSNVSTGFDYEGFGITNIDIQIKSQVAPTVVIDFVDVRAATLFEQGSCSPYGFFFQLPYPVFELTVKGYYGKAATYYLNLVKFNAKFNADTGNMECRAEFVGYSFAFLSDILIGYVYAAGFLDSLSKRYNFDDTLRNVYGSEAASFCNAPTNGGTRCLVISDLLKSLNTFDKVQKQKIIDSPEYFKLVQLKNLVNKYSEYRESINKLLEQIGDNLKQTTQATNPDVKGQKLKVFYGNDNKIVKKQISSGGILATHFNTQNGIFLNFIKNIMTIDVAGSYPYQLVPAVECLLKTTNQFQNQNNTNNTIFPLYDNTKITSKAWFGPSNFWGIEQDIPSGSRAITYGFTSSDTGSDYFIDFGFILENINEEIKNLEIEVKKETDSVTATIDNLIESTLGFKPTIQNVFTIILANTEAFVEVLKKVSIEAERYHSTESLNQYTQGDQNSKVENTKSLADGNKSKVFSWPTYSVKETSVGSTQVAEYEKYPGEESNFKSWPEVIFVEDFLKAYLKAKEFDDLLNANFEGKPGYDNFTPINPLESPAWFPTTPNKYKDTVGKPEMYKVIGERLFMALDHSLFQPIRLTDDSLRIPVIGKTKNWSPITPKNEKEFVSLIAELDSWNLLNSTTDLNLIRGLTASLSSESVFIETIKTELQKNDLKTPLKELKGADLKKTAGGYFPENRFNKDDIFYGYMSTEKGISIKKDENDDDIWVHPNPFKMEDDGHLIKIISPEEQNNLRGVNLTNEDFKSFLTKYQENLIIKTSGIDFSSTAFGDNKDTFPKNLTIIDDKQYLISFDKPQLYTSLAMSFFPINVEFSEWWKSGNLNTNTSDGVGGNIVSNMGMITFWDKTDDDLNIPTGVNLTTDENGQDDIFVDSLGYKSFKLDDQTEIDPADDVKEDDSLFLPLITTPLWLDNVIDFRKKIRGENIATENYTPDTQYKNLAYLFLHTLKCTPFVKRLISTEGWADNSGGKLLYSDDNFIDTFFKIIVVGELNNQQPSIIWTHRAFNTIGGIAKVPKAWLLTLGAQLWRWREFTGSKKGEKWKKPLACISCKKYDPPIGDDPLIQPSYNSFNGDKIISDSNKKPVPFRENLKLYLEKVYGPGYQTKYNTKSPKSVFTNESQRRTKGQKINTLEISNINYGSTYISFRYLNYIKGKIGLGFDQWLKDYDGSGDGLGVDFSWPGLYIAPHHIPYISPEAFTDPDSGGGAAFTLVPGINPKGDSYWIGQQDYLTIMPNNVNWENYDEKNGNGEDVGPTYRSKYQDGNLGMIIQYIPDKIKDQIVEIFEIWALEEWQNTLIKIVDPINFPSSSSSVLTDSYTFIKGKNSPAANVPDTAVLENISNGSTDYFVLSLKAEKSELLKLLTDQYWILNSTPKIWYGIGDVKINPNESDPDKTNAFYDESFIVTKTQFETYLTKFYQSYQLNFPKRIKELEDQNKNESDTGDPLKDNDLKLSIYRSFKSLSEKWLQRTPDGTKIFFNLGVNTGNNCNKENSEGKLASHFKFVNRVWGNIGQSSVIDISKLNEIKDNKKMSLYQLIGNILTDNEFMFFPLPTYIDLAASNSEKSDSEIVKMFQPVLELDSASCGPLFVCMYVGGTSRKLDLQIGSTNCKVDNVELSEIMNNVNNDSYNLSDVNLPPDIASGSFTAFKILYGQQNQNHFKNIQLDQSEFTETAESLNVIDKLAQNQGSDRTTKGQSLMPAYLTRSYTCSVEMMGNMMIQPMTYFDLQGVPMFSGAYIITEVSHNVKPNTVSTTFKGVRQPRTIVPVITSVSSAMNLTLSEKGTGKGTDLSTVSTNENIRRNKARDGGLNWKDQINTNVEPKIKSTDKDDQIMNVIRNFVEGGYYHPVHWYINDKGAKKNFNLYKRSGETMFGEDRAAGKTESTSDGAAYWAYIDTKSGYGDYGTLSPTKPNQNANAINNYSRNHRTAEKVRDDGPWDEAILQELSLRTNVWKFNEGKPGTPSNTDPELIKLSNKMSKTQLNLFFKNNFLNLKVSTLEIRKALKTKIESDGRLLFAWYRARFNGPGFFQNYAEKLIKVYSENTNITNDDLLIKDLDNRWEYAQGLNAGSAQLIKNDVLKIAEIVGVKPKNNSIKST